MTRAVRSRDRRRGHARRTDAGSVPVEVALVTPALLALLMLVIVTGRVVDARADVQSAAAAAARAASQRDSPRAAMRAAVDAATANLGDGTTCHDVEVDARVGDVDAGGTVTVTVSCTADMSDLALVAVPGRQSFSATSTEVVDTYRGAGG